MYAWLHLIFVRHHGALKLQTIELDKQSKLKAVQDLVKLITAMSQVYGKPKGI